MAVGKSFTIECRVPAVEPLDSLTLSLLRGSETLHSQTFGKAAPALQEATATFSSMAHREDGHHNFSCLAVLDLMSRGGEVFCTHSAPKMLEIYGEGGSMDGVGSEKPLSAPWGKKNLKPHLGSKHPGAHPSR